MANDKQTIKVREARRMLQHPAVVTSFSSLLMHRAIKGLNQTELSAMVGVSRRTIQNIEHDKTIPSVLVALQLAKVLDVQVEDLFKLKYELPRKTRYPKGVYGYDDKRSRLSYQRYKSE